MRRGCRGAVIVAVTLLETKSGQSSNMGEAPGDGTRGFGTCKNNLKTSSDEG